MSPEVLDDSLRALAWNYMFGHVSDEEALARRARELIDLGAKLPSRDDPFWSSVWSEITRR